MTGGVVEIRAEGMLLRLPDDRPAQFRGHADVPGGDRAPRGSR